MNSFFYIATSVIGFIVMGWPIYKKINNVLSEIDTRIIHLTVEIKHINYKYDLIDSRIKDMNEKLDRHLLAIKEPLEAAKPIKPNNWDSVKEVFKGPVRINERARTF